MKSTGWFIGTKNLSLCHVLGMQHGTGILHFILDTFYLKSAQLLQERK